MEDEDMVLAQDLNVLDHPERVEDPPAPLQAEVIPSAAIIARLAANFNSSSRVQDVPLAPLQPLEDVNVASNSDLQANPVTDRMAQGSQQVALQGVESEASNEGFQGADMVVDPFHLPDFLPARHDQDSSPPRGIIDLNLNVNMALTQFQLPDPHLTGSKVASWPNLLFEGNKNPKVSLPPNVFRLWAQFFFPVGCPAQVVDIPADWASFFTVMLLSPSHFDWDKSFLASKVWNLFLITAKPQALMSFSIPAKCLEGVSVICRDLLQAAESAPGQSARLDLQSEEEDAMIQTRKPKGKSGGPLVETEARRSPRLRNRNLGFKQSLCSSKNCLACNALPPSIPKKLMKTMGEDLCKIKPGKFEEEDLLVRKRGKQPIGSRKPKSSSGKEQDEEEEGPEAQDHSKKARK
jgi:hypothetical protein